MNQLSEYAYNVTSQFGEDGIIEEIFKRIGTSSKTCVEFGAWDGKHLSNTWNLWHNLGWNGILIEGDAEKYHELVGNYGHCSSLTLINAYVATEDESSLDHILSRHNIPSTIDLLSIDIDGDEYYVFRSLVQYSARVVIIEHNPTIPPDISVVQGPGEYFGASALALQELLTSKGYVLAACTETNSFYLIASEFSKLKIDPPQLKDIFPRNNFTYVITSYDGRTFLSGNPVYALRIAPESVSNLVTKKYNYYFNDYDEHIEIRDKEKIIPSSIYYNHFYNKRTKKLSLLVYERFYAYITGLPFLGRLITSLENNLNEYVTILKWMASEKQHSAPHIVKQRLIAKYRRAYSVNTFIETGTYLGEMVDAVLGHFDQIYSIEIDPNLYKAAQARFSHADNVELLLGDSSEMLGELLLKVEARCIFWLDGHYSEGVTGKGSLETPIISEINSIHAHRIKNHIILIDDARSFNGTNDYPVLSEFLMFLESKMPNHTISVRDGVIQILP